MVSTAHSIAESSDPWNVYGIGGRHTQKMPVKMPRMMGEATTSASPTPFFLPVSLCSLSQSA